MKTLLSRFVRRRLHRALPFFAEMYHQQLQGVAKNKKNGGSMSRKALPPVIKPTGVNKEQSPSNNKEATPKKERKTAASAIQPVISR